MRCDGRDNTKKLCSFISIVIVQKNFFVGEEDGYSRCALTETYEKFKVEI